MSATSKLFIIIIGDFREQVLEIVIGASRAVTAVRPSHIILLPAKSGEIQTRCHPECAEGARRISTATSRSIPALRGKTAALTSRKPVLPDGLRHTNLSVRLEKTSPNQFENGRRRNSTQNLAVPAQKIRESRASCSARE